MYFVRYWLQAFLSHLLEALQVWLSVWSWSFATHVSFVGQFQKGLYLYLALLISCEAYSWISFNLMNHQLIHHSSMILNLISQSFDLYSNKSLAQPIDYYSFHSYLFISVDYNSIPNLAAIHFNLSLVCSDWWGNRHGFLNHACRHRLTSSHCISLKLLYLASVLPLWSLLAFLILEHQVYFCFDSWLAW